MTAKKKGGEQSPPATSREVLVFVDRRDVVPIEKGDAEKASFAAKGTWIPSFTLEHLQKLMIKLDAPPVADTFNAQEIALKVSFLISTTRKLAKRSPRPSNAEYSDSWREKLEQSAELLGKYIPKLIEIKRVEISEFQARKPFADTGSISFALETIKTLERAQHAVEDAAFHLSWPGRRKRGQHGSPALRDVYVPTEIFCRLEHAWMEAGQEPATNKKKYEIISACLALASINVTAEVIRKSVTKLLADFPEYSDYLQDAKNYGRS